MDRQQLETYISEKRMDKILEEAEKIKLAPILIPSYKFRETAHLLRKFSFQSKTYVFVYDDDYSESGYDRFPFPDNVEFVRITQKDFEDLGLKWRGLRPKRVFMQNWLKKRGITRYFTMDDDLDPTACDIVWEQRNNKCKSNKTRRIPMELMCKVIQLVGDCCPEYKLLGTESPFSLHFFDWKKAVSDGKTVAQLFFFNNFDMMFTSNDEVLEDVELCLKCINARVMFGKVKFLYIKPMDDLEESIAGKEFRHANTFLLAPNILKLKLKNDRQLWCTVNYNAVRKGNQNFDHILEKYCREGNYDAAREYLRLGKEESGTVSEEFDINRL